MNFLKSYVDAATKRASAEADKLAAEASRAAADASKLTAEKEATVQKAAAEVDATAKRTAAEVAKLAADADAARKVAAKTSAEAANIVADTRFKTMRRLAIPVVVTALVLDYVYHEHESFIKWRMKRHLRAGVPWPHKTPRPAFMFPQAKDDSPPHWAFNHFFFSARLDVGSPHFCIKWRSCTSPFARQC